MKRRLIILGATLTVAILSALMPGAAWGATNPPSAPIDLLPEDTRIEGTALSMFWTDTSYTQTDPDNETAFEVERCTGADCTDFALVLSVGPGMTWALDDTPKAEDTVYSYRVRAVNDAGASAYTNVGTARTSWHRPAQPSDFTASYADGAVSMSWVDNADNETSYVVERCEVGICFATEPIGDLAPNTTTFVDTNLLQGSSYFYRVRAFRNTVWTGYSEPVELRAGDSIAAPAALTTTPAARAVTLTWRNRVPSRVQVWRCEANCLDLAGHWTREGQNWKAIAKLPIGTVTYRDKTVTRHHDYVYRVRAAKPHRVSRFKFSASTTK
jgi:hypothetical protein